jgi:hypothetical protein
MLASFAGHRLANAPISLSRMEAMTETGAAISVLSAPQIRLSRQAQTVKEERRIRNQ